MRVTTTNRIILLPAAKEALSGIDAKSAPSDIKRFQNWMEAKYPNVKYGKFGQFDADTQAAWNKYGDEFTNRSKTPTTDKKLKRVGNTVPDDNSEDQKEGKKSLMDKWKALPIGGKIGVIGGIVGLGIIVTVAISAATKKD